MNIERKIAFNVGALFIITMILGMIDAYTVAPVLKTPFDNIVSSDTRLYVGALAILLMSIGVAGIALWLYPILERYNKVIALTYLAFRIIECLLLIIGVLVYLLLIKLGQIHISTGSPETSYFQNISTLAVEMRYSAYHIAMFILGLGSIMLCYLFYQTKLIPRFIAVTGLVGYTLVMLSAPLDIIGIIDTTGAGGLMYVPGGIFEILLFPIWLIFKGFNPSPVDSKPGV